MSGIDRWIQALLWPASMPASRAKANCIVILRHVYAILRALAEGELTLRATGLVYTTMLALVPLLAFSFSLLKGLGFHRRLEPLLLNFLTPLGARASEITDNVIVFVDNVSGSTLGSVSILLLLYAALSMAQKVESSFNFVWRVDRPRSLARRFSEYLSVMLVGPLVMTVAMSLIATVSSATVMNRLRGLPTIGTWVGDLGELTPYLLVVGAFTFLYVFVPNSKVRFGPAVVGGLFAGTVWASSGNLFASFVVSASRTEAIYSGFAIVFVAMFWMYLSWLILLLGAQLAYYVQNPEDLRFGQRKVTMSNGLRERLALSIMLLVGRDFDKPAHGWRTASLAAQLRLPRHQLEPVMAALNSAGLLTSTEEQRLMPARDLHSIKLTDILDAVRDPERSEIGVEDNSWNAAVQALAQRIDQAIESTMNDATLADLIVQDAPSDPASPDSTAA
jgi:membrane protein